MIQVPLQVNAFTVSLFNFYTILCVHFAICFIFSIFVVRRGDNAGLVFITSPPVDLAMIKKRCIDLKKLFIHLICLRKSTRKVAA